MWMLCPQVWAMGVCRSSPHGRGWRGGEARAFRHRQGVALRVDLDRGARAVPIEPDDPGASDPHGHVEAERGEARGERPCGGCPGRGGYLCQTESKELREKILFLNPQSFCKT
jgi:hypothetical protein